MGAACLLEPYLFEVAGGIPCAHSLDVDFMRARLNWVRGCAPGSQLHMDLRRCRPEIDAPLKAGVLAHGACPPVPQPAVCSRTSLNLRVPASAGTRGSTRTLHPHLRGAKAAVGHVQDVPLFERPQTQNDRKVAFEAYPCGLFQVGARGFEPPTSETRVL